VDEQQREDGARLGAGQRHRAAVGEHIERTQDPELHG